MAQAIRPDIFTDFSNLHTIRDEEEAKKAGVDPEDMALAYLSHLRGWVVLKAYIEAIKKELDNMVTVSMEAGATFEEIGKRSLLSSLTKTALDKVINKVEDAKDEVEQSKK